MVLEVKAFLNGFSCLMGFVICFLIFSNDRTFGFWHLRRIFLFKGFFNVLVLATSEHGVFQ